MRPHDLPESMALPELLEEPLDKISSLACKAWKVLGELGLRRKPPAPLLESSVDAAVPKKHFGAVPRGHMDGATGIQDARQRVWQYQNELYRALALRAREQLLGAESRKVTVDISQPGKDKG